MKPKTIEAHQCRQCKTVFADREAAALCCGEKKCANKRCNNTTRTHLCGPCEGAEQLIETSYRNIGRAERAIEAARMRVKDATKEFLRVRKVEKMDMVGQRRNIRIAERYLKKKQ